MNHRTGINSRKILALSTYGILSLCLLAGCSSPEQQSENIFDLPEGFSMESVVSPDLISYPMFASFDDQGRLFVFESTGTNDMETEVMLNEPSYQIRLLTDTDQDGLFDQSVIFADGIPFPMGGTFYDGSLYAVASPDLLKLTDTDGDGRADQREVVLTGWTLNHNGAILSGPYMGPDGWMYMADARRGFDITTKEGRRLQGKGARIWRCLPDGSRLEWLSGGGFDNSIEIDFMPSGDPIGTMTYFRDPADGQRDALMHWVKGGVYPKPGAVIQEDQLKLTGDLMPVLTKMPRVAPAGIVRFRGDQWGNDYNGNWFSAIFNTGQVLRHKIRPEGGSYQSKDEVFLSTSFPDIHPTDVLQDGNGDMLVVVTGGWFIKGCPLSRVAKPNVPGGIFRIKKDGNHRRDDSWGTEIAFNTKSTVELDDLLDDERPMVRQNALKALESRGEAAINILNKRLLNDSEEVRLGALFSLDHLGLEKSYVSVRSALDDRDESMRVAAARLTGLSKDEKAVPQLKNLVMNDPSAGVRRQAATALGQIGNQDAITALLNATEGVEDRFLLHAIRYALITLDQPDQVISGLSHPDKSVKMTALITLDQMDSSPLTKEQVRPFLTSSDKKLQDAGIWVTKHHPEWSGIVTEFLQKKLTQSTLSAEELGDLENLMVSFCGDPGLQSYIQKTLNKSSIPENTRLALLHVMSRCSGTVPKEWISSLGGQLNSSSDNVRSSALDVIETRQIKGLESKLTDLLVSTTEDPELYLKVLTSRISSQPELSSDEFKQLESFLNSSFTVPVRRSAILVLEKSDLTTDQLMNLARTVLPASDEITFPGLGRLFEEDSTEEIGQILIPALLQQKEYLNALSEEDLNKILGGYPDSIQTMGKPLMQILQKQNEERLNQLHNLEEKLVKGDVGRGRTLFFGKAICSTCHAVGQEGHDFGPDLTNIGEIRSRHDLLESIEYPGISFARQYETYIIKTSERTYTGILAEELTKGIVVLKTTPGQTVRIPKEEILSMEPGDVSMMPSGLTRSLSNQELSDLVAFLQSLPYTVDRLIELSE